MARMISEWIGILMLVALLIWATEGGCAVDDHEARRAVENHGFRDVQLGDTTMFACQTGEASRSFIAIGPDHRLVAGTVCCGVVSKGCVLRWD